MSDHADNGSGAGPVVRAALSNATIDTGAAEALKADAPSTVRASVCPVVVMAEQLNFDQSSNIWLSQVSTLLPHITKAIFPMGQCG